MKKPLDPHLVAFGLAFARAAVDEMLAEQASTKQEIRDEQSKKQGRHKPHKAAKP